MSTIDHVTPRSAGALTFSPDGVLFVGDNKLGAVFAFETEWGQAPASLDPFLFESIDEKIAAALGVTAKSLVMNGMAVHPVTREPYLSVGVRDGDLLEPAVVRVSLNGEAHPFDLSSSNVTVHQLSDVPDEDKTFQSRAGTFPYPPATGKVTAWTQPRHRHQEFLRFLKQVAKAYPEREPLLIMDNYAAHKRVEIRDWLAVNPRVQVHFTPTSASWMNMVEIWFGIIERQASTAAASAPSKTSTPKSAPS